MKRLMMLLAVVFVFGFVGCKDDEEKIPETPTGISASVASDGIRISWNPVRDVDNYIIYRQEVISEDFEQITSTVGASLDSYTDISGIAGTEYRYAVAARNRVGTSSRSQPSGIRVFPNGNIGTLVPPTGLSTVPQGPNSITIRWDSVIGAIGYKVYRDTSATGSFSNLVSEGNYFAGTRFTNTGLQANTEYYYKVSTVNSNDVEGEKSIDASGKTSAEVDDTGIDFESYYPNNNYAFLITNHSNQRLIAFKSTLQEQNIVGGIPERAAVHGIKRDDVKFPISQGFALILLTEGQYIANKDFLGNPLIVPYARVFIAFNKNGTNEKVYEINAHSGGNYTIQIHNNTGMNIELRRDGINGIPIGLAPDNMDNVTFYVDRGDYMLYPVFLKYNTLRDELVTVYPKFESDGTALRTQVTVDDGGRNQIFPLAQLLTQDYRFSTGAAHLIIRNDLLGGSVDLQIGNDRILNLWGTYGIRSGEERTFPILMSKIGDNRYAERQSIATYSIGQTGTRVYIGNHELELDRVYKVTVTGTNITNLQVSELVPIGIIDLSDFD